MCTQQHHSHLVSTAWGSLLNARPWPAADLEIAECPECMSSLSRALTWDSMHNLSAAFGRLAHYIKIRKEQPQ